MSVPQLRIDIMPSLKDLTGQTFGRWSVVRRNGTSPGRATLWLCRCECGTEKTIQGGNLVNGVSTSCGCYHSEVLGAMRRTHGKSETRLYKTWKSMRQRCFNPNDRGFRDYGARGITICPEWTTFERFQEWALSSGYRDDLTIERLDFNQGYKPSNCTWIPGGEQTFNKRDTTKNNAGQLWVHVAEANGISKRAYYGRVFNGWSPEEASTRPMRAPRLSKER